MLGKRRLVLFCVVDVLTLAAACALAQPLAPAGATGENTLIERDTPYRHSSDIGNFQVTWPGGCGQLKIQSKPLAPGGGEDGVGFVYHSVCERGGVEGEGCSVTATLGATDGKGGPAGREQVLTQVREMLENFGVEIVDQRPVKHALENGQQIVGLEVRGTGADGQGEFWVRGLLYDHNVYALLAWSTQGDLWDNPEFQAFFNEFLPYAE